MDKLTCIRCGEPKTYDEMVKDSRKSSGIKEVCKKCDSIRSAACTRKRRDLLDKEPSESFILFKINNNKREESFIFLCFYFVK